MNILLSTFGTVTQPNVLTRFGNVESGGIGKLLNLFFSLLISVAGIYMLFNFIFAGYGFLSAGNDPKKIQAASAKIWQSILGLLVVAGSFVIAAIIGLLFYDSPGAILNPSIPLP